jgi:hypothetical protein
VRARVRGDIEKLFPDAKVTTNAGTDYRFRGILARAVVASKMAR